MYEDKGVRMPGAAPSDSYGPPLIQQYRIMEHPPTKAILYMAGGTYFAIHLPHQPTRWQRWWQWKLLGFRYVPAGTPK